jgi:predicted RecA/RadA family phage recombinase
MKQEFVRVQHTPSGNVAAGAVVLVGNYVTFAPQAIAANTLGSVVVSGKAEVAKFGAVSAAAWTPGQKIYYDESEEEFTHVATGNIFAGIVPPDGAALTADTTGLLLINVLSLNDPGEAAALVNQTQDELTLTGMTGTANTAPAAETNIDTLTGTLTGVLNNTLADVAAAAGACAGAATPSATDVDTAIATAAAGLATGANKNFKEIQAELTTQKALNTVLINDMKTMATQLNKIKVDYAALLTSMKNAGSMASA